MRTKMMLYPLGVILSTALVVMMSMRLNEALQIRHSPLFQSGAKSGNPSVRPFGICTTRALRNGQHCFSSPLTPRIIKVSHEIDQISFGGISLWMSSPNTPGPSEAKQDGDGKGGDSGNGDSTTLLKVIDKAGSRLKPKAAQATSKMALAETKPRKLLYLIQSCILYSLFILYRAYRGFFVILPEVFRQVYKKLENAVEYPFDDGDNYNAVNGAAPDVNPKTGKVRWRTRITVSVLASFVTLSYVIGGAIRVVYRLLRYLSSNPSDVPGSFAAAAYEQEQNEDKILRKIAKKIITDGSGSNSNRRINGGKDDDDDDDNSSDENSGLAP